MQKYSPSDIRNFAIAGHASCGKTMLSEAMLACAGVIGRMGRIAEGSTVSDYHVSEKQRHISVQTSLLHAEWMGKKFNIIDTPGYLDFSSETLSGLRVADFALIVIHAQHGISVGTERAWNYATDFGIPKILVINGLDKVNSNFDQALASARSHFGPGVFPMNLPINPGPGFNQALDVLRNEIVTYDLAAGRGKFTEVPATGPWQDQVTKLHRELIEHIAESDDSLLTKYLDEGGLSEEEFRAGIHDAVQKQHFIPLFCTAAETNTGVARLMDFIAKYGSSPVDRKRYAALDDTTRRLDSVRDLASAIGRRSRRPCRRRAIGSVTAIARKRNPGRAVSESPLA